MTELRKKAASDKADKSLKDLIWLCFDKSLFMSVFNLDEPIQYAGRIHQTTKLVSSLMVAMRVSMQR